MPGGKKSVSKRNKGVIPAKVNKEEPSSSKDPLMSPDVGLQLILEKHVITDNLFQYLSVPELLNLSLVSKNLMALTRDYIRRRRQCLLTICHKDDYGASLLTMVNFMKKRFLKEHHPFTGLLITSERQSQPKNRKEQQSLENERIKAGVINQLLSEIVANIKSVTIKNVVFKNVSAKSGIFRSAKLIEDIENLEFINSTFCWSSIAAEANELKFSNLTSVKHDSEDNYFMSPKFLTACPALTSWPNLVQHEEVQGFVEAGKSNLVKKLMIASTVELDHIRSIEAAGLILEELNLKQLVTQRDALQYFEGILGIIRRTSGTLKTLHISTVFLDQLLKSSLGSLRLLSNVTVWYGMRDDDESEESQERARELILNARRGLMFPVAEFHTDVLDQELYEFWMSAEDYYID